jgi:diadenosine tetraphosphate (Ap4A) HIT family hydrolase
MAGCLLCSNLENRGGPIRLGDGFSLTADAAALAPGHALFFPDVHVKSFGELGADALASAQQVLEHRVLGKLIPRDRFIAFEHGIGPNGNAVHGCVDHAHIHLLPLDQIDQTYESIVEAFTPDLATIDRAISFVDLAAMAAAEYFWISDCDLRPNLLHPAGLERQVLRKIIGKGLKRRDFRTWDDYDLARATATTRRWRELFDGEKFSVG